MGELIFILNTQSCCIATTNCSMSIEIKSFFLKGSTKTTYIHSSLLITDGLQLKEEITLNLK